MHTVQVESHIDKQGFLRLKLPQEWADQDVNVVVVLEKKAIPLVSKKPNLVQAFELLAEMPDDFMLDGRQDSLPQEREALV